MIKVINAVIFILLLMWFSAGLWLDFPSLPHQSVKAILKGEAVTNTEELIEKQIPLRQIIIEMWAKIRYLLFNEGNSGVLIGKNGWLFSREEFLWPDNGSDTLTKNIANMVQLNELLKENNVQLYVVLVPAKAEVYPQYAPFLSAQIQYRLRETMYNELDSLQINVFDSFTALSVTSKNEPVFLKTDTHWSWQGAERVAQAFASQFNYLQKNSHFERTFSAPQCKLGDLTTFIPAGDDWLIAQLGGDVLTVPYTSLIEDDLDDLFATESSPVLALVGTSYSADSQWDFVGGLQMALNTEIVNYALEGEGPFIPMLRFIQDEILQKRAIRHVIWEVPVRYMIQEPTLTTTFIQELRSKN